MILLRLFRFLRPKSLLIFDIVCCCIDDHLIKFETCPMRSKQRYCDQRMFIGYFSFIQGSVVLGGVVGSAVGAGPGEGGVQQ